MQGTRPNYELMRTGPVCCFAPRGCNPRCRAYVKQGDTCRVLELLKEIHAKLAAGDGV